MSPRAIGSSNGAVTLTADGAGSDSEPSEIDLGAWESTQGRIRCNETAGGIIDRPAAIVCPRP